MVAKTILREFGEIDKDGKLEIYDRAGFLDRLKVNSNRSVELVLLKFEDEISQKQRRYYFSVVVPHVRAAFFRFGYDFSKSQTDLVLRSFFLQREAYHQDSDEWVHEPRRLSLKETDVTKKEFSHFLERVVRFCAEELEHSIPFPIKISE